MSKKFFIILIFFIFCNYQYGYTDSIARWSSFAETKKAEKVLDWLHRIAVNYLSRKSDKLKINIKFPQFYGVNGIFVTLIKNDKVRGCYGAFSHSSADIKEVLKDYLIGALRYDVRYKPIGIEEINDIKIIITITTPFYPISDLESLDISRYGIMVKENNQPGIVIVPAEIKTISYLKKIIKKYPKGVLYSFRAVTIQ